MKSKAVYIDVDILTFEDNVLAISHSKPVIVDFWADWCSPCIVLAPILERVASDYGDELLLAKVEVDDGENMKLAGRYKLRGFPTVILFMQGEEVAQFSGAKPYHEVKKFLDKNVKK